MLFNKLSAEPPTNHNLYGPLVSGCAAQLSGAVSAAVIGLAVPSTHQVIESHQSAQMQREGSLFSQLVSNENISRDTFCRGHLSHSTRVCGDGGPCVINKDHGTLQKFYMGEEGNQKHLEELHYCCWLLQANASGELGVAGEGDWRS